MRENIIIEHPALGRQFKAFKKSINMRRCFEAIRNCAGLNIFKQSSIIYGCLKAGMQLKNKIAACLVGIFMVGKVSNLSKVQNILIFIYLFGKLS